MPYSITPLEGAREDSGNWSTFDVSITPHDSLGPKGQVILIVGLLVWLCVQEAWMTIAIHWIGGLFLGFDVGFLILALSLHRRFRRRRETITIENGGLLVRRVVGRRLVDQRRFSIFGLSFERFDDPDFGCLRLCLSQRGRTTEIARDLAPAERDEFCRVLVDALSSVGGGPRVRRVTAAPLMPINAGIAR